MENRLVLYQFNINMEADSKGSNRYRICLFFLDLVWFR